MNWLDLLLGSLLAGSTMAGLLKGLVRTVIGIASSVLAVILAFVFYREAGGFLREYVSTEAIANALGFMCVFVATALAGALISRLLAAAFKWAGVGWLDRLLGGAFGLARGLLVSIVIVMALMAFSSKPPPEAVVESVIAPYVIDAARFLSQAAPQEVTDAVHGSYEKVKKVWSETWEKGVPKKLEY